MNKVLNEKVMYACNDGYKVMLVVMEHDGERYSRYRWYNPNGEDIADAYFEGGEWW